MSFIARARLALNELGCDRHDSKPLKVSESGDGDAFVDPSHHDIHQVDVLGPLILGRYRAFQADFSWHNAWYIHVISLSNKPFSRRLRRNTPQCRFLPRKIFFQFNAFYTRKNGKGPSNCAYSNDLAN
jgi:hypothetical protein